MTQPKQTLGNWRIIFHEGIGDNVAEMKTLDAGYKWLDCAYECIHCGECLGCNRKLVVNLDGELDEDEMHCDKSPTGYHEVEYD